MRSILNKHSQVSIATENHYLGHLLPWEGARHAFGRLGDLDDDATIHRIVEAIYGPRFQQGTWLRESSPYWRFIGQQVPPEDLLARLLAAERTERGIFTALLQVYADHRGRPIIGEKTPAHIAFADTLMGWYPHARIVHMIRDPRGIFVSEVRRRDDQAVTVPYRWLVHVPAAMRAFILLEVVWAWAQATSSHRALRRRYPANYRMVRFEDLVADPESTVADICAFLGIAPEPRMLRQKVGSRGAMLGQVGFDSGAADRWRDTIGAREARWISRLLGRRLADMGYPRD
jgi:hypothetical protein